MSTKPDVDDYWKSLTGALPRYTPAEQAVAVALYRELAKGSPVSTEQLAEALGDTASATRRLLTSDALDCMTYRDDTGRVIGFGGLATVPMKHRLRIEGHDLWTWCAWDGLFIPRILGARGEVRSVDPRTGEEVRVLATPDGIGGCSPATAVVSLLLPDPTEFASSAARVMTSFCNFVYFFASGHSGRAWIADREGTFLYSMPEAFELGRRLADRVSGTAQTAAQRR